ncbi:efflux RND transporter periplasmic adaptor subunit [Siculibacillus lacustris]|uniref:Efflux RND transporter periplasmic adaptor subunit n=1 Tax=Siculibacillus lacustris TaxID=1549641 RepID=A0A4Q9VV51_9HYPH|nr:efflux RND transporter periplasmic adaptor subunit [Siculibacillus lacustris]TBW40098.1 efflux RND transporter periplasmic adaptor subunit [Siculibacillus lacustris]
MSRTRIFFSLVAVAAAAGAAAWYAGLLPTPKWPLRTPSPSATVEAPPGPPGGPPGGPGGPGGGGRRGGGAGDGPTPVLVVPVERRDVDLMFDGIGTIQASATVTVRPQVQGILLELRFQDGQEVAKGDVLARIDPTSYRAVYDQAVAKREQNEADLRNARADLERYTRLAQSESGSRQQADTQRATVAKLEAQSKIDQGVIDAAKVDLDNTTILAPIGGRTGIRSVDAGNLVRTTDAAGLVTIAQLKPISVVFTLPQQQLAQVLAAKLRGPVPVEVLGPDRRSAIDRGSIEVIDNQVDSTTGTVKIKASLPNAELRLWPGQFADVRVHVDTSRDAVVVPTAAVQRGADGAFVYVLGAEDKVARRPVEVARQDENRAVIASGLQPGETVVATGFARLIDGARVKPTAATPAAVEAVPDASVSPAAPADDAAKTPAERRKARGDGAGRRPGAAPAPGEATPSGAPAPGPAAGPRP